ncbi:MAG: SDR family oxidoreductase [Alphaproteobacteria bacterium]
MKILVTGALGHIGSKLIRELPKHFQNCHIVMVDDLSTQRYCSLFDLPQMASYCFIESRVQNLDFNKVLNGVDFVIHLAALTDAAGTADRPQQVHDNNFESTRLLSEACLTAEIPFIFPSTTSVYGSQSELVDEECIDLAPQSPYADCKIKEEKYLKTLFQKGLKGTICRFGTIYGTSPGMRFHTAVNKFCWQAVLKQPITVWETAMDQKRPYLDLADACDALVWIIKKKLVDGETYNIVSNNYTVRQVVEEIQKNISTLDVVLTPHKIMNQLSYEVAADKIKKTGFLFKGSMEKGIFETVNLLKNCNQ